MLEIDIKQFMKRKSISDSWNEEDITDKRLKIEVQPPQTNELDRVKRFVNVHLHHRQQPEKDKQNFDVVFIGKISADAHGCADFDLILGSWNVVLFGSIILSHSKTISAEVVSFLNL